MKKTWYHISCVLAILTAIIFACRDEGTLTPEEESIISSSWLNNIDRKELERAQKWYEDHKWEIYSTARSSIGKHPLFAAMEPYWQGAFSSQMGEEFKTVESPISTVKRKIFVTEGNAYLYQESKDPGHLQTITRLVLLTNIKTGKDRGFFMTIIPEDDPMAGTKVNLAAVSYSRVDKNFNGYVLYHKLNGDFINGWHVRKGKATRALRKKQNSNPLSRSSSERICYMNYEEICEIQDAYVTIGEHSEPKGSTLINCEYRNIGIYCFEENTLPPYNDGSTGPIPSKDDDDDTDKCPVCLQNKDNCICPRFVDCNDQAIKNGSAADKSWALLEAANIQNMFITPYQHAEYEYGCVLNYNKNTSSYILTEPKTNHSVNNVALSFASGNIYTVATIHNHPRDNPPSIQDIFTLAKMNNQTEGKFTSSFVQTKDGRIYVLQVENQDKAKNFYYKYRNSEGYLESQTNSMLSKNVSDNFAKILRQIGYDDVNTENSHKAYGLARFLKEEDAGIVLLSRENVQSNFKQHFTKDSIIIHESGGRDTLVIRYICK